MKSINRYNLSLIAVLLACGAPFAHAANHREAPLTALDAKADITDWFAFVSYDDPSKVTMILNVDPLLEPSNGPNYFPFDPEILYEMKVDNDFDAEEDLTLQFRFKTESRLPGVFTSFVGIGDGLNTPFNSPAPLPAGTPLVPAAITALDGPGSEGLGLRQSYTVTLIKGKGKNRQVIELNGGQKLYAVPANVGPRTMPDYPALAKQGIYDLAGGIKVFAGTADDPFYIDLGAAFDTLNFRSGASGVGVPGVLSDAQSADDVSNFAPDDVAGFNVNSIAIELPIAMLTQDGKLHGANEAFAVIGTYATTSRPRTKSYAEKPGGRPKLANAYTQIQRMGNPLVNELLIGTGDKDKFSMSEPRQDADYAGYVLDPLIARVLNAGTGGQLPVPAPPRVKPDQPDFDLGPLVFYAAPICPACTSVQRGPIADLLRLNTGIAPHVRDGAQTDGLFGGR